MKKRVLLIIAGILVFLLIVGLVYRAISKVDNTESSLTEYAPPSSTLAPYISTSTTTVEETSTTQPVMKINGNVGTVAPPQTAAPLQEDKVQHTYETLPAPTVPENPQDLKEAIDPATVGPPGAGAQQTQQGPAEQFNPSPHIDEFWLKAKYLDVDVCSSYTTKDLGNVMGEVDNEQTFSAQKGACYFVPKDLKQTSGAVELFPANSEWVQRIYGNLSNTSPITIPGFTAAKVVTYPASEKEPNPPTIIVAENDTYSTVITTANAQLSPESRLEDAIKMTEGTGEWLERNKPNPTKLAAGLDAATDVTVVSTTTSTSMPLPSTTTASPRSLLPVILITTVAASIIGIAALSFRKLN